MHRVQVSVERFRTLLRLILSALFQLAQTDRVIEILSDILVEEDQIFQLSVVESRSRVSEESPVGDKYRTRARVGEDKFNLIDCLRGVNRHIDRTKAQDRQVCDGPFRPVLRKQGYAISRADTQRG